MNQQLSNSMWIYKISKWLKDDKEILEVEEKLARFYENSNFFHRLANGRKTANTIWKILSVDV